MMDQRMKAVVIRKPRYRPTVFVTEATRTGGVVPSQVCEYAS